MSSGGLGPIAPAPGLGGGPPPGASPPGLWQPPGLGGIAAGPPSQPPPPATAPPPPGVGGAFGLGAVGEGREELQKEISGTIEAQVSRLIEQARHDTESKVKTELKAIREAMMTLDGRLDHLIAQLDGIEPQEPAEPAFDGETVGRLLSKIEQQWGQEIRTLKQELHQTILAHNHNADLIKHHKDTIDALRERCLKLQGNNVKTSEFQVQLQRLDARLKQQQKQRKLEPLFERLAVLEQRVAGAAAAHWRYGGMPPAAPPGMAVPPGIPPGMMPGMGAAGAAGAAGLLAAKAAGAKAGFAPAAAAAAAASATAALAAGAVPPGPKNSEKAAFKCPTDEEVQAQLIKLATGGGIGAEVAPREEAQAAAESASAKAAPVSPSAEAEEAS